MNPFEILFRDDILLSSRLLVGADVLCGIGILAALVSILFHARPSADGTRPGWVAHGPILFLTLATATMATAVGHRWVEVNHFPSQTMAEVLAMFTLALGVSMIVLWIALGLRKRGHGWAIVEDVLILLVLAGVVFTHAYVRTLATAQRDLPPALQSWWFAPHLSCLIFSYATMGIAALIALVYFLTRFWSGVYRGGQSWQSQAWILAGLLLIPFAHLVTIPLLLVSAVVFAALLAAGRVPGADTVLRLEKELDDVSFRAFAVGFPFLTAGLWQGAFWAQEAWANYWGWDSKENSALITWLVYVIYIHLRLLGGYRGAKAMSALVAGALSVFLTFQIFGYLPDSQKSLHRYTDDGVEPQEGQQGPAPSAQQAKAEVGGATSAEPR
ncbi:MAG: cytochrome c biogenesis protein CcsA [Planctomycetota bacterium]|nr:cytochrome c biogenesis protein CcsA [Planctomycetota bacterium]